MAVFSALSFTAPWILAALASLPAIWLLMRATPPAPARVRFPAFAILRGLRDAEQTPDKTPWWLLLLRLLITALIIIALAGPVLNAPKTSARTGPLVLVVDDSWAAAPAWRARIDAMQAAIAEADGRGASVFIVTAADPDSDAPAEPPTAEPLSAEQARDRAGALVPKPYRADRDAAAKRLAAFDAALERAGGGADIRWLTDGLASENAGEDDAFAKTLGELGELTVLSDNGAGVFVVRRPAEAPGSAAFEIMRAAPDGDWSGEVVALARDGRELSRQSITLADGVRSAAVEVDLPLALRNELSVLRLDRVASAGAARLTDARDRRALIGLVDGDRGDADRLLSGVYYIERALEPHAAFLSDRLENLLLSDVSVIVLDDIGRLRPGDADALTTWVEAGGVVIRFAGPNLADAAQDGAPALLPAPLRGGGRAFGGALSWETPQALGPFNPDGPFADLTPPDDVFIRRQVLASPGGDTSKATWASLADGTPLVTGTRLGEGALVLFHVTATPSWSDLPLSSIMIDMLRKLTFLSILSPETAEAQATARFAPLRMLNGFGAFEPPQASQLGVTAAQADEGPAPGRPPGFYGAPDAPLAINAVSETETLEPLRLAGAPVAAYEAEPPTRLAPPLIAAALCLFLLDAFASLAISGRLRIAAPAAKAEAPSAAPSASISGSRPGARTGSGAKPGASAAAAVALILLVGANPDPASAQPRHAPGDDTAASAALETRLAFVRTGDAALDRISERGLAALSDALTRRTAIEPAPPVGVDPETDDLSVYPLLYWPIAPGAGGLSEAGLANIENFMRFGGMIIFDTRDDERAVAGLETPERAALREILSQVDVPPLTPLPSEHVLKRSYYLLTDLPGRMWNNPVWVRAAGGANDAVTPLIISGRDWAGAWAVDEYGRSILPVGRAGSRILRCAPRTNVPVRECAIRAGINMVMVAFTGNYKSDQVHTPILLRRLGRREP